MKRIISILIVAALMISRVSSLAEVTVIDSTSDRNITINKAGDNTVEAGVSPTTGRTLNEIEVPEGFGGMAASGEYLPVLVQVTNSGAGTGYRAPWFAASADVIYESPKTKDGTTRYTMVYNDLIPEWVGCVRSIRVQHVWIREEWNGPFLYWGHQSDPQKRTDVESEIIALGYRNPQASKGEKPSLFYDGLYDTKPWGKYRFRVEKLKNPDDAIYHLSDVMENVVSNEVFTPRNHTYLFSDTLPKGGDEAGTVYVMFNTKAAKTSDEYYFNTMLQYEPDDGVYYRWILRDLENPDNSVLFEEMTPTNIRKNSDGGIVCDFNTGDPIAFSNVIVQHIDMTWVDGNSSMPLPTMTGTGNADYFMGGRHYSGVWNRDTLQERTVFYDENGQEMPMQRGKTLIILMDSDRETREVRYE